MRAEKLCSTEAVVVRMVEIDFVIFMFVPVWWPTIVELCKGFPS